jgi:hypothetical protein
MNQPNERSFTPNDEPMENAQDDRLIDPRDLVYKGGYYKNPREIVENPGATPETLDQAPEDLRGDLMDDPDLDENQATSD